MIRTAQESDLPAIYEIYMRSVAASKTPVGAVWNKAQFHSEWEAGRTWLGQDDRGRLQLFLFARHNGQAWEITQLATDPPYWRLGLMEALLLRVIEELAPPIWLEVHEINTPACRLYEKLGFVLVGKRSGYYMDGGAALLFSKS